MKPDLRDPIFPVTALVVLNHTSVSGSRIVLSLFALHLGAKPFTIGLLIALYAIIPLFLSVWSGRLADRHGFHVPMLLGFLVLFTGLLLPFLAPRMATLYFSAALCGAGFVFFNNAVQALVGVLSRSETRAFNFSTLAMGYSISSLTGPPLVGYAIEFMGHPRTYLLLAGIVTAGLVLMYFIRGIVTGARVPAASGPRRATDLLRERPLLKMFLASGVCVTGWDLFTFYMPIHGKSIGLSESTIGNIIGMFGVATLIVRVFVPGLTRRLGEHRVLELALYLGAVVFLLFPLLSNVWALAALAFLMGLGLGCGQPLTMMLTYNYSPPGRAGEANGMRQMANNVTHIFVPLFFGAVGSAFGMAPAFWINALFLTGGGWMSRRK